MPTPPANGIALSLSPDPNQTGWVTNNNSVFKTDDQLHTGILKSQAYASIVQFDLRMLAPGSKIQFATFEIGVSPGSKPGASGEWAIDLLDTSTSNWHTASYTTVQNIPVLFHIGAPLQSTDLSGSAKKHFVFSALQLDLLSKQIDRGTITVRLTGPITGGDDELIWSGTTDSQGPTLSLIAIPTTFTVITQTPTAISIFAEATRVSIQTLQARQYGTATPLPRSMATATPVPYVIITDVPTPSDLADRTATAVYATVMAATTGTFTPTPLNRITTTPYPLLIPIASLTPTPTAKPSPTAVPAMLMAKQPIPAGLENKIVFMSGVRDTPDVLVMDPDGKNLTLLTDKTLYDVFAARDVVSPDGQWVVYNAPETNWNGVLQIWRRNLLNPAQPPIQVSYAPRGYTYSPAWSPDGRKIVYTSTQDFAHDIFLYNLDDPKRWFRLTNSPELYFVNQHPSWSPDGKQIVYASDQSRPAKLTEIWIMNADGSGAHNLGDGKRDAWAPIWIKWSK